MEKKKPTLRNKESQKNDNEGNEMIIIGLVFVVLQIVIYCVKGINYFNNITNIYMFLFDLLGFIAYSFVGLFGILLIVLGAIKNNKKPKE